MDPQLHSRKVSARHHFEKNGLQPYLLSNCRVVGSGSSMSASVTRSSSSLKDVVPLRPREADQSTLFEFRSIKLIVRVRLSERRESGSGMNSPTSVARK